MTISTQASRQDYTGNGCTKAFAYTFKIIAGTDLDVFVGGCQKLITTDYTVSGAGAETGGTVTFVTAPSCNLAVAIVRDVPYTQATDYPENDPFPALSHEDALDKLTMLVQQIKEFATRSWRFAAGSARAAAGYTVDEPVASKFVRIKSDCSGVDYVALEACGTYINPITTKGDLLVGTDGSQERLAISAGRTLVADPDTGKPSWQPGLSVQFTNKLDLALTAGDVVAVDKGCDRAVVAADAQACQRVFVVAPAAIGDDCLALFHYYGLIRDVKSTGCVDRGFYVRKSATARAVECTGTEMGVAAPPAGALGVAVTQAAGNLVDVIFWGAPAAGATDKLIDLSPLSAAFAGSDCSPTLVRNLGVQSHEYTLDFDDVNMACCTWEKVLPEGLVVGTAKFFIASRMAFACSGTVGWILRTKAVGDGGGWDTSYDNCDVIAAATVKATVGCALFQCVTLTTTGWAADRRLRVKLLRDVAADNASGKAKVLGAYIRIT